MLRRLLLATIVILACLGAAVFALPYVISSQTVREEVASQISSLTGRAVTLRGNQALQVFPNLSVALTDVVIEGDLPGVENALAVTETLRGTVRPLPLLFGRIELSSFELTRPTIRLLRNADGASNWMLDGSDLVTALGPDTDDGRNLELGRLRIIDGTLRLVDEVRGVDETVSSADLILAWPSSSTRAALSGSAIWRGEEIELSASIDQPAALTQSGSTSGMVVSIAGTPMRLRFDGTVSPGSFGDDHVPWQASGQVNLDTPSLRSAATWLGREVPTGSTFGPFQLDADMNLVGSSLDLTDLTLSLDGNEADGVLTIDWPSPDHVAADEPKQPSVQGTLDFAQLDLSAYLATLQPTTTAAAPTDWRYLGLPNVFAAPVRLDLRFASRQVLASQLTLGETAGSLLLNPQRMVLGIAEATAYGGVLRGSVTIERGDGAEVPTVTMLDVIADNVALAPFLSAWQDRPALTGSAQLQAMLRGEGETMAALMESLDGDATFSLTNGVLAGVDLDRVGRSLSERTLDVAAFAEAGETQLTALTGSLSARRGVARLSDLMLETETLALSLAGRSRLAARSLLLSGEVSVAVDPNARMMVPFDVRGTWSDPLLLPDLAASETQETTEN